jgi:hypothetical protein
VTIPLHSLSPLPLESHWQYGDALAYPHLYLLSNQALRNKFDELCTSLIFLKETQSLPGCSLVNTSLISRGHKLPAYGNMTELCRFQKHHLPSPMELFVSFPQSSQHSRKSSVFPVLDPKARTVSLMFMLRNLVAPHVCARFESDVHISTKLKYD